MGGHGGGHDVDHSQERHAGYGWLIFCVIGMMSSLTMFGIVMEYATSGGRKLHELTYVFVTTSIYATIAYIARDLFGEKHSEISKYNMLTLSLTSISSTYTSVRSLRYVIYPVQILFKSCKPVPVMIFGVILGKRYPLKKYVNVFIITCGVALFMGGGSSSGKAEAGANSTMLGALLLSISLCFDGATGAYEDKIMGSDHVGPFDLMYNIQLGKSVMSFCALVATNGINDFFTSLNQDGISLIFLGVTGAVGQVFVFLTISKFGALNCSIIGLFRKMLSLFLSFVLYGHSMNAVQTVGLTLAITSMIANFYDKGGKKKNEDKDAKEALPYEKESLLEGGSSSVEMTGARQDGDDGNDDDDDNEEEEESSGIFITAAADDKDDNLSVDLVNQDFGSGASTTDNDLLDLDDAGAQPNGQQGKDTFSAIL